MNDELLIRICGFLWGLVGVLLIIAFVEAYETEKQMENTMCNCSCCMESEAEE